MQKTRSHGWDDCPTPADAETLPGGFVRIHCDPDLHPARQFCPKVPLCETPEPGSDAARRFPAARKSLFLNYSVELPLSARSCGGVLEFPDSHHPESWLLRGQEFSSFPGCPLVAHRPVRFAETQPARSSSEFPLFAHSPVVRGFLDGYHPESLKQTARSSRFFPITLLSIPILVVSRKHHRLVLLRSFRLSRILRLSGGSSMAITRSPRSNTARVLAFPDYPLVDPDPCRFEETLPARSSCGVSGFRAFSGCPGVPRWLSPGLPEATRPGFSLLPRLPSCRSRSLSFRGNTTGSFFLRSFRLSRILRLSGGSSMALTRTPRSNTARVLALPDYPLVDPDPCRFEETLRARSSSEFPAFAHSPVVRGFLDGYHPDSPKQHGQDSLLFPDYPLVDPKSLSFRGNTTGSSSSEFPAFAHSPVVRGFLDDYHQQHVRVLASSPIVLLSLVVLVVPLRRS